MMTEQELINAFMKLTAKAGAGVYIKKLLQEVDTNGNPKQWTQSEMINAIQYINNLVDAFGRKDAVEVVNTLISKFDLNPDDLNFERSPDHNEPSLGVKGLQ